MKKISTRAYIENFTEIGVTSRHFVTTDAGCDHISPERREERREPVTRRYRTEPAALDQLVEALYQLLVDVPTDASGTAAAPVDSACLSAPHE